MDILEKKKKRLKREKNPIDALAIILLICWVKKLNNMSLYIFILMLNRDI